jgi:hypothetical protein
MLPAPIGMYRCSSKFRFMYPNSRSELPSAFGIHPSNDGAMFCPCEY